MQAILDHRGNARKTGSDYRAAWVTPWAAWLTGAREGKKMPMPRAFFSASNEGAGRPFMTYPFRRDRAPADYFFI
jgi:hypothetical protein